MVFSSLYSPKKALPVKGTHLLLLLLLASSVTFSQKQADFWQFGTLAGLDFNSGSPVALTNSALNTTEGSSSISDAAGNLLFYTDGIKVWDNTNTQMPNGFGLLGDVSTTQSALIVPNPGNANLYYIFTLPAEGAGSFCYSVVDMTLNSGKGDVTTKNTVLKSNVTEKQTAVYHCNSHDIWVTIHEAGTNAFYSYLVTNSGINAPVISHVGPVHTDVHGQMKFNTSGTRIALARDTVITPTSPPNPGTGVGYIDVFDFDNATGLVTNPLVLTSSHQKTYGVEFSPDGSRLYAGYYDVAASSTLVQFDLTAPNVQNAMIQLQNSSDNDIYSLQLGPDHKIYIPRKVSPFVDVINSPNLQGLACNYTMSAVNIDPLGMGNMCLLGTPAFIQSYFNVNFPTVPCAVTANFQSSDTTICAGSCINFTDLSSGMVTSWNWSFPGAATTTSTAQNPTGICYASTGTYSVQLTASNSTSSATVVKNIIVVSASIDAGANVTMSPGDSTQLVASGSVASYTWTPATGLSATNIANPVASPTTSVTYYVSGTDGNGCVASDSVNITVEIKCGDIFVPTGFSPNNDGENDLECVLGNCITSLQFSIYDRWGEKVFETSDPKFCWDGIYKGKLMDNAVFVYYLKATLSNGDEINKKGNISLVR
jgi:gliding motility-associated-like protein